MQILLTDTVGFIQKLPTKLVASFRATLVRTLLIWVAALRWRLPARRGPARLGGREAPRHRIDGLMCALLLVRPLPSSRTRGIRPSPMCRHLRLVTCSLDILIGCIGEYRSLGWPVKARRRKSSSSAHAD
jgi:hypothetical protein